MFLSIINEGGYKTGIFGKWHLGENYPYLPQYRGFDEVYSFGEGMISCSADYWNNDYFDDTYEVNGKQRNLSLIVLKQMNLSFVIFQQMHHMDLTILQKNIKFLMKTQIKIFMGQLPT